MAVEISTGFVYNLPWIKTKPIVVPTQKETVFTGDFYLEEASFSNVTDGDITVNVFDLQATPVAFMDTVTIRARSVYVIVAKARWFPGGLTWKASAAGVVGFIRGRK